MKQKTERRKRPVTSTVYEMREKTSRDLIDLLAALNRFLHHRLYRKIKYSIQIERIRSNLNAILNVEPHDYDNETLAGIWSQIDYYAYHMVKYDEETRRIIVSESSTSPHNDSLIVENSNMVIL